MAIAFKAKWIIPSDGNIYENCALIVDEGKVVEIIKQENLVESDYSIVKDFQNSVITAGFVNLHNHLQYSFLEDRKKSNLRAKIKKLYTIFQKHYFLAGISKKSFIYSSANVALIFNPLGSPLVSFI